MKKTIQSVPLIKAAVELDRDPSTLRRWCRGKKLPEGSFERKGRDWFIFLTPEVFEAAAQIRRGPQSSEQRKQQRSHSNE